MVTPSKPRTSGFSNLQDVADDRRSLTKSRNGDASPARGRGGSKYAPRGEDDKRRLRRITQTVKQALEPFYRTGRSTAILTGGSVPAAETIRSFLESTVGDRSRRDVRASSAVDLNAFRKCLYALGIASDDTAFLLESIDRDRAGEMDTRAFAAMFLPFKPTLQGGSGAPRTGMRRRFPGYSSSDENNDERAIGASTIEAFHRKVLERVLVKYATVKDAFRQYDTGRAGVLTVPQFRIFLRDVGFVGSDVDALICHLDRDQQQHAISFRAFATTNGSTHYLSKQSPSKRTALVQPLDVTRRRALPSEPEETDPIERIRTKMRQRVIGRSKSIREVFLEFDADGNGHLDHAEFTQFMGAYQFTMDETRQAIAFLDRDASGTIDYDEFASGLLFYRPVQKMIQSPVQKPLSEAERQRRQGEYLVSIVREKLETAAAGELTSLRDEFTRFDADGSGALDYGEFSAFLMGLGIKLSPRDLDALMLIVDHDRSNEIEFREFTQIFSSQDPVNKPAARRIPTQATVHNNSTATANALVAHILRDHGSLAAAFNNHDRDSSGELDHDEFRRFLIQYGVRDQHEIQQLIQTLDHDQSGTISVDEFLRHFQPPKQRLNPSTDSAALRELKQVWVDEVLERYGSLSAAFRAFDPQSRNELDYEQFRDLLSQCGVSDDRNVRVLLRQVDADDSGAVSLEEFLTVFNAVSKSRPKQRQSPHKTKKKTAPPTLERRPVKGSLAADQAATRAARLRLLEEAWIQNALAAHGSVRAAFDAFDADASGTLDHDEFRQLLTAFGIARDDDMASMIRRLDVDASGTIDFDEFATLFHAARVHSVHRKPPQSLTPLHPPQQQPSKEDSKKTAAARLRELELKWIERALSCHATIEAAFREYDRDGSGALDHDEFAHCMTRYGIVQPDDIARLIQRLDLDGSGTVDIHEFTTVFNPLRRRDGSTMSSSFPSISGDRGAAEDDELQSVLEIERELAERILRHTRDMRAAFHTFDVNGNGRLEYSEFRSVLKRYKFPEPEIRKVIRHLDRDVSGYIDYREFIAGLGATGDGRSTTTTTSPGKKANHRKHTSPAKTTSVSRNPSARIETLKQHLRERMLATHGTIQSAFRHYDTARNGALTRHQFETMGRDLGLSSDDARVLLNHLDTDQSRTIEYDEFRSRLTTEENR